MKFGTIFKGHAFFNHHFWLNQTFFFLYRDSVRTLSRSPNGPEVAGLTLTGTLRQQVDLSERLEKNPGESKGMMLANNPSIIII